MPKGLLIWQVFAILNNRKDGKAISLAVQRHLSHSFMSVFSAKQKPDLALHCFSLSIQSLTMQK